MNKYVVLYKTEAALQGMSAADMFANTPPEQLEAGMAMWKAWHDSCADAIVDLGAPLDKPVEVKDGVSTPVKSAVSGYSILQAESLAAATDLMKGHPHFFAPGASIEVFECVKIPGM